MKVTSINDRVREVLGRKIISAKPSQGFFAITYEPMNSTVLTVYFNQDGREVFSTETPEPRLRWYQRIYEWFTKRN